MELACSASEYFFFISLPLPFPVPALLFVPFSSNQNLCVIEQGEIVNPLIAHACLTSSAVG